MLANKIVTRIPHVKELRAWGNNQDGRTGLGITLDVFIPTQIGNVSGVGSNSSTDYHTLFVETNGTLWSFGQNNNGKTGLNLSTGNTLVPTQVGTDTDWASCSAGIAHSLAIKTNGTLWSFGDNTNGKTGLNLSSGNTLVPTQVGTSTDWASCSAGNTHSLAIKTNGTLWSWGNNTNGMTGLNLSTGNTLVPTQVGTDTDWRISSAGGSHSLAMKTSGMLWSWGYNGDGATGQNTTTGSVKVPTQIGTDTDWASCSAGRYHSLAIKTNGTLWSFGQNSYGKTGLNTINGNALVPTQVGIDTNWASCCSGRFHSLAIKTNGTLWSFGENASGKTGLNTVSGNTLVPTQVGIDTNWSSCNAGNQHSITMKTGKTLHSFGSSLFGQTGLGIANYQLIPKSISLQWTSCSAGGSHSLLIKSDGTLWSFGDNTYGQTGLNTTEIDTVYPTQIGTDTDWASCSAGGSHSLAIKTNGTLWSFGQTGPLGLGSGGNALVPTRVGTDTDWRTCSAGAYHSLAVKTNGTLWSFGQNSYGMTGLNTTAGSTLTPTQVGADTDWASCSAGTYYSLAIKTNGTLWSFGQNTNGKTGLNLSTGNALVPTQVGTDTDWASCSAGNTHSLAIKTNGTLWSFGSGANYRTGTGSTSDTLIPTQISTLSWISCSAGGSHSLVVRSDGLLCAFGSNGSGVTGFNSTIGNTNYGELGSINEWNTCSAGSLHSLAIGFT